MANYPNKNLTGQTIQSVYPNLLQMVSSSILVDGLGTSSLDFNTYTASYSNTASIGLMGTSASYSLTSSMAMSINGGINNFFEKSDFSIVVFTTTNSQSLSLNQDLLVFINNNAVIYTSSSNVIMPNPLLAGNDYGIYATYDNLLIATYTNTGSTPISGYTTPAGYTSTNSRLIGGFYFAHSGSSPITSISRSRSAGGVNATASVTASAGHNLITDDYIDITDIAAVPVFSYNSYNTPIWVSGNIISYANSGSTESPIVDTGLQIWKINNNGIINQYSLWDLKFRPGCSDPRGMVLVDNRFWVDIWLTSNNYLTKGSSRKGERIADGENATSYPLISTNMGGTGINTYGNCTWFAATEVAAHWGKRLLSYADYQIAAYGTTEAASFGTDPQYNCRTSTFTSKWGMEQASGVMFIWGNDLNYRWDHQTSVSSTYRSRNSSSVATITSSAHGLSVGDIVTIIGFTGTPGTTYNRSLVTIQSVPSTTTFTYNCVSGSTPEVLTSAAGTISSGIPTFNYVNQAGGRGQLYIQGPSGLVAGLYGGNWYSGTNAGSRGSSWYNFVWTYNSTVGFRSCFDHIVVP